MESEPKQQNGSFVSDVLMPSLLAGIFLASLAYTLLRFLNLL